MDDKDLIEKLKILLIYGKREVDGKNKDGVEERIYKAISDLLESYIASGKSDIYVTVTYTIDKDGMLTVKINQMPYDKLELDINTK